MNEFFEETKRLFTYFVLCLIVLLVDDAMTFRVWQLCWVDAAAFALAIPIVAVSADTFANLLGILGNKVFGYVVLGSGAVAIASPVVEAFVHGDHRVVVAATIVALRAFVFVLTMTLCAGGRGGSLKRRRKIADAVERLVKAVEAVHGEPVPAAQACSVRRPRPTW